MSNVAWKDLTPIVLLILLVLGICLSNGPVLFIYSSIIFKLECLIILVYTLIHKKIPVKLITDHSWVAYGLSIWVVLFSARYAIVLYRDGFSEGWLYVHTLFHAIFFLYAIDIISKTRGLERVSKNFTILKNINRESFLFVLLCLLTFSIAVTSGHNSMKNADIVLKHELIFIAAYIFTVKPVPDISKLFKEHSSVAWLLVFWFLLVTISYFASPYELIKKYYGIARYNQTFFHMVFFIFVFRFLLEIKKNKKHLVLMIPLSTVMLSLIFLFSWFVSDMNSVANWMDNPPLNDHIRHTGYIATASTSIALTFVLYPGQIGKQTILYVLLLLISATLLFWTGGRASAISVLGIYFLIIAYFTYVNRLKIERLLISCVTLALAIYLSELLAVFDWNGITYGASRINMSSDMQTLTTGRTAIWSSVLESLENHWIFGLGPQGYIFMPNRIYGVQPHNMFLQFIVEWGLLGAGIFLLLVIRAGIGVTKSLKNRKTITTAPFLSATAILISLTIHGLVDGTYYHGQPSYYLALAFALCLSTIIVDGGIKNSQSKMAPLTTQ